MGSCITKIPKEHTVPLSNVKDIKHITLTPSTSSTTTHDMEQQVNNNDNINNIVQYLIYGYITDLENEFLSIKIPKVIRQMILLYFFDGEYFEKLGKNILSSNGFMTISKIDDSSCYLYGDWYNTTYSHYWIDSMSNNITKWTLIINKLGVSSTEIEFGIVSTDNYQNNDFTRNQHGKLYSFTNDGHYRDQYRNIEYEHSHSTSNDEYGFFGNTNHRKRIWNIFDDNYKEKEMFMDKNSISFGSGDKLSIILNLKKRILIQEINDNEKMILCKRVEINEKIKYKLAVSMFSPQNSITLIYYNQYN